MATTHELSTLGHVIKPAYEGMADTNAYTDAEKAKLAGIATAATANATDAQLRDRSTHTGVQPAATIVDLPDVLAGKVDAVPGKTLSDANFTAAEKEKLAGLEDAHFKGVHVGLSGLEDAHPTAQAGDYAVVDDGVDLTWYQWSGTAWTARVGESAEVTPAQVKQYYESNPDTNAYTDAHSAFVTDVLANNRFTWRRRGTWNAATNTPQLLDGSGSPGDYYVATTAGTQNFGTGDHTFFVGDFVLFEGGTWKRMAMVDSVKSVNGKNGTVTLNASDVGALPSTYTAPVSSVNSKTGAVSLTSADVGARASSWVPSWTDVTGKPDLNSLYAKKSRGTLGFPIMAAYLWRNVATPCAPSTSVQWVPNSEVFDPLNIHTDGVITLPSWASYVRVTGGFTFDANSEGDRYVGIVLNTSTILGTRIRATAGGSTIINFISPPWAVTGARTLTFNVFQSSTATINVATNSWMCIELYEGP